MGDYLFGAAKLINNTDSNKYGYRDYDIGFDSCSQFLLPNKVWGKNVAIFGVDNSLLLHAEKKDRKDNFLVKDNETD